MLADHQAGAIFQNLEALADDGGVVAQQHAARHERQGVGQARQDTVLARHVVAAGRQVAHWRAAQHIRLSPEMDEVIEVGESAGELARRRIGVERQAARGEERAHGVPGERDALLGRTQIGRRFVRQGASCRQAAMPLLIAESAHSIQQVPKRSTLSARSMRPRCEVAVPAA